MQDDFFTPEDAVAPASTEELEEAEPTPTPSPRAGKRQRQAGATAPVTPAKGLRGTLAGVADTLRDVFTGTQRRAEAEEAHEEAQEGAPGPSGALARPVKKARTRGTAVKSAPAPVAAKGRTAGGRGRGRRRVHREESYKRYIYRVLRQIHPEMGISSKAMAVMHAFVADLYERIAEEASRLTLVGKRSTLTAREIQTAVRLVLPGELSKHAVSEGKKAVGRVAGVRMPNEV